MRRLPATSALVFLGLAAPTLGSGGPPPQSAAVVKLVTCHTGSRPADRFAVFRAQQRTTFPGDQMSLRFDLYRHGSKGYTEVRRQAGGWLKSGVFGRAFRLTRGTNRAGDPTFTLEVR